MVKNLNTIERSERVRIGKYTPDEQAINSVIINASSELFEANVSGFHVAPIRKDSSVLSNTLVYNTVTKEIVDSGENINKTLEDVTLIGNTTPYTVEFQNINTGFVTTSNVGIANTNPVHTLDVGTRFFVDENASNVMDVTGNVFVSDTLFVVGNLEVLGDTTLVTQQNLLIDDSIVELGKNNYDSGAGFDLGFVMTRSTAVSNVGVGYREAQDEFFIGYTDNNAYEHYLTPNSDNNVKVHVYGSLMTDANVGVANTTPIHTLDVGSNLYVDDTASNILVVHGDTKIDETLFANDISISNVLDVSGNLNALTELNVTGNVYASSNLDVNRELNVAGNVYASSNVDVSGVLNVTGDIEASSNVNVTKDLNVTGNTHANSDLNVLGETRAFANLYVYRDQTTYGNVYASSNVDISGELNVTGNVYASSNVDVSKELNVTGNVYASSNVDISGELNVTGNVYASSDVNVTKKLNVTDDIVASKDVRVTRDVIVTRDIQTSNITATKKITAFGDIEALSNVDVDKNLIVSGNVFAHSNVSVWKDLDVAGNIYALTDVNVTRNLTTTGNIHANSNIFVAKGLDVNGDLKANANLHVFKDLNVTKNINASSNINVTKDLIVTGNVYANTNVIVSNNLVVSGNAYMNSDALIQKKLYVTSDVEAGSDIYVARDANVARNVIVSGDVTASYYYGSGNTLSNITLEQVTSYGNTTSNTVFFNNPDISLVTVGDMGVGTDTPDHKLHVAGDIRADTDVYAVKYHGDGGLLSNVTLQVVSDKGNTTSNTLQFTNGHTAFTTDLVSNVEVKLDQLNSVTIDGLEEDNLLVYDGNKWVNEYNLHNFIKVRNETGTDMKAGNVVYVTNFFNNNIASVALAKSDSSATMPAIGVLNADLADGKTGVAVAYGKVTNANTYGYTEGQTVYVSNTVAGNIMGTKPYGLDDKIQNVGICVRADANNGIIFVTGVGRSNDIPNAPIETTTSPYVYVNTANNNLRKIVPSNLLTKLQTLDQVVNTGNVVSNTIQVTGLTTTSNINIGGNVSVDGLTVNYLPIVGANNYLVDSPIRKDNGNIIIGSDTEITGNLFITGNSISITSNSLIINDRILGIANNNPSHNLDTGLIIEHPGHNIAIIHHGDEDRFSLGYTQNTVTDDHVTPDSNIFFLDVLGNVTVQNNLTVNETVYANIFEGDGGLLSNLATNFEEIIVNGNTTSNVVEFRNATSIVTTGYVGIANVAPAHELSVGSNLYVDDTGSNVLHVVGNVYATSFVGDGSQLDNIASNLEEIVNNGNVASSTIGLLNPDVAISALGNISANYFIGDGSKLDNIASNLEEIVNNGNVASSIIGLLNPDLGLSALGNISANYFIGDGSKLDNIASNLHEIVLNGNVTNLTTEFRNATSVVTTGAVGVANTAPAHDLSVGSNLYIDDNGSNVLHVVGNVYATSFIGDGSQLDNIASNLEEIVLNGNVTSQTIQIQNTVSLITTGSVGIANTTPEHDLSVGTNVWIDDDGSNVLTVDGNILAHKMTLDSIQIASVYALEYVTMTGNSTSNTIHFTNPTTGLVTTANVGIANNSPVHTLDVGSNLYIDDVGSNVLYVNGNVHVAGSQLTTDGALGVANTSPAHDLSVGSNLYVDDDGSNVLVVSGNASFGHTITLGAVEITPAYDLEEVTGEGNTTSNVIQFTNSNAGVVTSGGIITNSDSYACKRYAYSNVSVPFGFSNVEMSFASNVFYAKITAQLLHGNEEVSTLTFDAQGGTRNGTTSSLDVAIGSKSLFGNTNTKPWNSTVSTTPTKVIIEPYAAGTQNYGLDLFVEYMSSAPDGKLNSVNIGADTVKSFIY